MAASYHKVRQFEFQLAKQNKERAGVITVMEERNSRGPFTTTDTSALPSEATTRKLTFVKSSSLTCSYKLKDNIIQIGWN